jgi:riboflavin kinase/FMN adenylyltransferase
VLTFEPTPREFFDPAGAPARLTRLREKLPLLAAQQVDRCIVLRFDGRLQKLKTEEFVDFLEQRLGARSVLVGHDFRFAHRGEGTVEALRAAGQARGFEVDVMPPVEAGGERVSSTLVRSALAVGNVKRARQLLGRNYSMCGRVVAGEQLGRRIGFATANIRLQRKVSALRGIFAVYVRGEGLERHPGVASVGTRPTLGEGLEWLIEVHLFDVDRDLYGRHLEVEFMAFLREERKFADLEAMVAQIHKDAERARSILP